MKFLIQVVAVAGLMALTSGCAKSAPKLETLDGGVCNNPKCQCPKPCPCGASCQCGKNGNSTKMMKK